MKKKNAWTIVLLVLAVAAWVGKPVWLRWIVRSENLFQANISLTQTGEETSISRMKGKVLLVSCFQTWCGECVREGRQLNQLAAGLDTSSFHVLYLTDESDAEITVFQNRFELNHIRFARLAEGLDKFNVRVFPTTFLVNKNGEVVLSKVGTYNWEWEKATIEKLMDE